ncbi:MAG TPA: sensor histidine kinase, partial [Spirillospora sp.]|nr:sensor histidine kinase [Spirillospora sp.]
KVIDNAIQYTPAAGTVSVRTCQRDGQALVEVEDTGIGIDSNDLPHIFNRLYRADKARSTETGGIGLGLPIAQKIIETHGGKIEVESTPRVGSIFRVWLPLPND